MTERAWLGIPVSARDASRRRPHVTRSPLRRGSRAGRRPLTGGTSRTRRASGRGTGSFPTPAATAHTGTVPRSGRARSARRERVASARATRSSPACKSIKVVPPHFRLVLFCVPLFFASDRIMLGERAARRQHAAMLRRLLADARSRSREIEPRLCRVVPGGVLVFAAPGDASAVRRLAHGTLVRVDGESAAAYRLSDGSGFLARSRACTETAPELDRVVELSPHVLEGGARVMSDSDRGASDPARGTGADQRWTAVLCRLAQAFC